MVRRTVVPAGMLGRMDLIGLLSNPETWIALATLTVLEIVLGIDNVIFISVLVQRVEAARRDQARQIGLGLAMGMRILLLLTISWIIGLTQPAFTIVGRDFSWRDVILIGGGLFLLYKATSEIHESLEGAEAHEPGPEGPASAAAASFGSVLVQIVLLDIVFSLDSVLTAVGMANDIAVMVAAVVIAVGVMLVASGPLSRFVHEHPSVKMLALSFLLLIGVTLIADGFGFHIDKAYIYAAMGFSVFVEALNLRRSSRRPVKLRTGYDPDPGRPRGQRRVRLADEPRDQPLADLRRDPQASRGCPRTSRHRRGSRSRRSRRDLDRSRPLRPPRPLPDRSCGSGPRGRRGPHRRVRAGCRAVPAPRGNGQGPGGRRAARIAAIAPSGSRPDPPDIAGSAVPEDPGESVLDAGRESGRDEGPREGRATERVVIARRQLGDLGVDRQPQLAQQVDGPRESRPPGRALAGEDRLERVVVRVHAEAQDVQLGLPQAEVAGHERVDLDARDEPHAGRDRVRSDEVAVAGQGVVVGEGEGPHAGRGHVLDRARAGSRTPSERVEWACRSTVEGSGGAAASCTACGSCRRRGRPGCSAGRGRGARDASGIGSRPR